ncbi:Eco57I restriction-modification methylase domain-containing protein [Sphingopyxis sp. MWB1]|uniref:Eco57I restriction-modification methylase domain-containing protein n=1 Tax=Sphingopyxis sp. MWB1 TaxID=1537715 RepID=UPI00068F1724|nr:Eco57I restriction-modification methylase domain-containing protein [Sphingopyxis sp. MWB1]
MNAQRSAIDDAIRAFADAPLQEAGLGLLDTLGYRSAKTIALDGSPATFAREVDHEGKLSAKPACFDRWQEVQFLFQLTNDEIPMLAHGQSAFDLQEKYGRSIVDSFVFLAIALEGDDWKRGALAGITRAVNAMFAMPVIILFKHGARFSLAASERRPNRRDASRDVQTGRISIILGVSTERPHRGHLSILAKLDWRAMRSRPSNFEELYACWRAALSTKTLNEAFYKELSHWFFWARDCVTFPEGAGEKAEVPLIRLLTRVIFCWFIKERGLIPDSLFRIEGVRPLLRSDPAKAGDEGNYYRAILQNLFFATLNTEMGEGRKWRSKSSGSGQDGHHMVHSLYRYQELFADPDAALALFRTVPFLNGGLFECLDREVTAKELERDPDLAKRAPDGKRLRVDGFSDHPKNPLHIPNRVFFGDEIKVDLNAIYETKGKDYRARGLFTLFDDYVFTVEENTSVEEEVALDPELLGKVFENLLASYNEETSTTARKKSGAFYTPRYVVDYMVRETLAHQFTRSLMAARPADNGGIRPNAQTFDLGPAPGELAMEPGKLRGKVDDAGSEFADRVAALLDPTQPVPNFTDKEAETLIATIEDLKVLDPACGSGAFPMGMLQALMEVLRRLDPDNARWKATLRAPLQRRVSDARNYDITRRETELEEAEAALAAFDEEFADNDLADYVRKLHLIEKCLYGSDIQPIAILIAKLRFFISLAVEQKPHKERPNLGIKPLPNLETKLVAANSLIPLERPKQDDLFANPRIRELERLTEDATQRHFGARTMKTKRKYRDLIQSYRDELSEILEHEHSLKHEDALKAAAWNPFDQNASAPFFDPLWMFQMHDGFDIVIGNPPYVRHEKIKDQKPALEKVYGQKDSKGIPLGSYAGTADYLVYFIERGLRLLKPGGAFSYITSNKWYRVKYGENLRFWVTRNTRLISIIDFGDADVFEAVAYPTILVAERRDGAGPLPDDRFRALNWQDLGEDADKEHFWTYLERAGFEMPQVALEKDGWQIEPTVKRDLLARIRTRGRRLLDYTGSTVFRGITTGLNQAFLLSQEEIAELDDNSVKLLRPYLGGKDLRRWAANPSRQWMLKIPSSANEQHPWTGKLSVEAERIFAETYPAVHRRFATKEMRKALIDRDDQGHFFWELRSCDYWADFNLPKVCSNKVTSKPTFCVDLNASVLGNTAYFFAHHDSAYLCAVLNSSVADFLYRSTFSSKQNGFYEIQPGPLGDFPVAVAGEQDHQIVVVLANALQALEGNPALEQLLNGLVYELYFPDDLHAHGLRLFDAAREAGLDRLSGLEGEELATASADFTKQKLAPGQPLRVMLSDLQTLDVVRIIEGKA